MSTESQYINIRIEKSTGKWDVTFTDKEGQKVAAPPEIRNIGSEEASQAIHIDEQINQMDRAVWYTYLPKGAETLRG